MAKIRYKFSPYTYARISAMKSLLLQKQDYDKIMKLDSSEIIKLLQEGVYAKEINDYAMKYSGLKLVETALNKHLERIFLKLKVISDQSIRYLMVQYLKRYDYWNLKTIFRAKLSKLTEEQILDMLIPVGNLNLAKLKKIIKMQTAREIIEFVGLRINDFEEAITKFDQSKDLSTLENLMDFHYYKDSVEFSAQIPKQGKLFKEFFNYEFDIYNIKLIAKKIYFELDKKEVEPYIIWSGRYLNRSLLSTMLRSKNVQDFMKEISKTPYRKLLTDLKLEEKSFLMKLEIYLEKFLLEKSKLLYHQHPLTVDIVLGYMFSMEIEVKNLRVMIKSKSLEFTEDYVKNLIVVK